MRVCKGCANGVCTPLRVQNRRSEGVRARGVHLCTGFRGVEAHTPPSLGAGVCPLTPPIRVHTCTPLTKPQVRGHKRVCTPLLHTLAQGVHR